MTGEAFTTLVAVRIADQNFVSHAHFANVFAGLHDYSSPYFAAISISDVRTSGLESVFVTFMSEDSRKLSWKNARRTR
jgi:hypothetical protein